MSSQLVDLSDAIAHHQCGEFDQAAAIYERVLNDQPEHPDALHLMGLIWLQRGRSDEALQFLKRAIGVQPENGTFHADLAEIYWAMGRTDRAAECGREAVRLQPENPETLSNLGATLLHLGELDGAVELFAEALRLRPDMAIVHNNLGNALRLKGELPAALDQYAHAARLQPHSHEIQSNLGKTLMELNEPYQALTHCELAVKLRPSFAAAQVNLGNVLHVLGRLDEALAAFHKAIQLQPDLPNAHAGLGNVLEELGEFDQAMATYRETLRLDPDHPGVLARLATRLGDKLPDTDRAAIEGRLAARSLTNEDRWKLLAGLAQYHDARGEFSIAADLTTQGNALHAAALNARGKGYNKDAHHQFIELLIASFTSKFFIATRGFGLETDRPVFIVGLPRSGTTLVEQILASHPRVFGGGELRLAQATFESLPTATGRTQPPLDCLIPLSREIVQILARRHLDSMSAINTSADRFVDKMPENTLYLGLLAVLFPRAQFVHCRRDLRDIATSCWITDFAYLNWTCDQDHIVSRIQEYQRLMDHWRQVLPVTILDVDYEEMVNEPEMVSRRLIAHCGLEWNSACLDFHKSRRPVQTASVAQVRQPVYRSSVGRWRNYEARLANMFTKLQNSPYVA